jgi:hypothetical protein
MKAILSAIIFFSTVAASAQNCNNNPTPKILLIGDSWANFMHLNQSVQDALNNYGFSDLGQLSDNNLTFAGARTTDFLNDTTKLNDLRDEILANPTLEYVHLSIGGNDVIYTWDVNYTQQQTDVLFDTVYNRTLRIIDYIHSVNPNLQIVFSGYVYTNFGDVIGALPSFLQSQHPYYATWSGMGFPDFQQLNNLLLSFTNRVKAYTNQQDRVHYVQALGLMQNFYGQNTPLSVPPSGTYSAATAPIDTGLLDYPSPEAAMLSLGNIPFTNFSITDCFHLSPTSFEVFMDNQFERYYMNSLMHDTIIKANFGGTVRQSGQTSTLLELGNTNQDESRLLLDFNYNLSDTGVSSASLFLRRKSAQNGNVINQASSISVDLFYQNAGASAAIASDDFNDIPETSSSACFYGDLDKNKNWLRIDLPLNTLPYLQTGTYQLRISANGVSGQKVEFYDSSNPDNAAFIDLTFGPKLQLPSAIETLSETEIKLFPNPSKVGRFYLENFQDIHQIKVYGLDGKLIDADFDKNNGVITLSTNVAGIYAVQLLDKNLRMVKVLKLSVIK